MKTKKLLGSNIFLGVMFTAVVVAIYSFTAGTVLASTIPNVEVVIKNGTNTTVNTATIGSAVRAQASVASSTGPIALGTVDFNLYSNTTCSGTPTTQNGVLLASGVANSATTTVGSNGLSYKVFYGGQADVYASTTSSCVGLTATSGNVAVNTTLSNTQVTVGGSVSQNASLTGLTANATGTVAYSVYTNNSCTADKIDAGVKTVANGTVSSSNSIQFNTVGTRYFQAVYSGDQFNSGATGQCQTFSVIGSPSTPNPVPVGNGTFSGTSYYDLNKNRVRDGGEVGIAGFTIKLYGGTFWWNWGKLKAVATTTTDANGNYSFTGLSDGIYRIEEKSLNGWNQISGDYRWVLMINGKSITGLDFANYSRVKASSTATSTPPRNNSKDDDRKERKEEKREEQKNKKINKLLEKIEKQESKGRGNSNDD